MEAVKTHDLELIKQMANQDFATILKRDPSLYEKVNTVVEKNFEGQSIKEVNPMQAMLKGMFGGKWD